ncbi:hypothetical protein C0J45_14350 [Silurus meridionalis]|nr:hypothetical protein C0J45_14350 [Silurus meridionalis]
MGLPVACAGPVLPALCIICKKKDKYITVADKRQKDHLSQAETLCADQLLKAAEMKKDTSILVHIQDKDCDSLEEFSHLHSLLSKLSKLELLEELNMSGNKLKTVPSTVSSCKRLHALILHSNNISVFPEVLNLPEIKETVTCIFLLHKSPDATKKSLKSQLGWGQMFFQVLLKIRAVVVLGSEACRKILKEEGVVSKLFRTSDQRMVVFVTF